MHHVVVVMMVMMMVMMVMHAAGVGRGDDRQSQECCENIGE